LKWKLKLKWKFLTTTPKSFACTKICDSYGIANVHHMLMSKILKGYFLVGYHSWCTFKFVQVVLMVKNFVNFWFCNEMQTQDTFFDSQKRKGHESSMMKLKQAFKLSSLSCQTIRTNKKRWLMFVTKMAYRQATS
jgi:hypothetical protein